MPDGANFDVPSAGTGNEPRAEPGLLEVDRPKNDKGQYLVRPGQTLALTLTLRNHGTEPIPTKIIIEVVCQNTKFADTVSFRVPAPDRTPPESVATTTWHGTATVPADCEPLGIPGAADGLVNAEVRTVAHASGRGESSTVTFRLAP